MQPFYPSYDPDAKLHDDDIRGIQRLYGKKSKDKKPSGGTTEGTTSSTYPTTVDVGHVDDELCEAAYIDAIITNTDDETYVFKGNNYQHFYTLCQ